MKIGIVSLYGWIKLWDNYGTLMQNYALQAFLRRNGHETFWIRTRDSTESKELHVSAHVRLLSSLRGVLVRLARPFRGASQNERLANFKLKNPRHFAAFMERHIPTTSIEYTIEELRQSPPDAGAFVVGSDQVWKYATPMNFLDFGGDEVLRVAYAVSAPWPLLSAEWYQRASGLVKRLAAISVREVEGLAVCERLARADAVQVVDPTLLLDADDYLELVDEAHVEDEPGVEVVLGYFVNVKRLRDIPWNAIDAFAESLDASLRVVPLQGSELVIPPKNVIAPAPSAWIGAFHSASYVVTNSFHGALFSVIMRRPFLVFLQTGATEAENCRFYSALRPLGLESRIISASTWSRCSAADLGHMINSPIDWRDVGEKLDALRQYSGRFLLEALTDQPDAAV